MVKKLIKKGTHVNAIDQYGEPPLHEAFSINVIKCLIENGANKTIKNNTFVYYAVHKRHISSTETKKP